MTSFTDAADRGISTKQGEMFKPRSKTLTQEDRNAPLIGPDPRGEGICIVRLVRPLGEAGADVAGNDPGLDNNLGQDVAAQGRGFADSRHWKVSRQAYGAPWAAAHGDEGGGLGLDDDCRR